MLTPRDLTFGLPFDISMVVFAAGAVIFAMGLGRAGSVTARRPLGTAATVGLVVWQLLVGPLFGALLFLGMLLFAWSPTDVSGSVAAFGAVNVVSVSIEVITLALSVIAVVQIGRIAVVPRPWNWAPLWALIAVVAAQLIPNVVATAGSITDQTLLNALFSLATLVTAAAVAFLGALGIVLAPRPARSEAGVAVSQS